MTTPPELAADTRPGVVGDPTLAARENGAAIVTAAVDRLVQAIEELASRASAAQTDAG